MSIYRNLPCITGKILCQTALNHFAVEFSLSHPLHYRLGNRSALEWVIDQYQITTDKRSGIPKRLHIAEIVAISAM